MTVAIATTDIPIKIHICALKLSPAWIYSHLKLMSKYKQHTSYWKGLVTASIFPRVSNAGYGMSSALSSTSNGTVNPTAVLRA